MKQEFVYPGSDLDRGKNLLALLGTYWSRTYGASDQLMSYVTATANTVTQTHRNLLELVAALSRYDVPLFHRETLVPIVIRKSQINSTVTNTIKFDRNSALFDSGVNFDRPATSSLYAFPLPAKLVRVGQIFNKITFPTVAFLPNIDFYVDEEIGALIFSDNPFENASLTRRAVVDGDLSDEEITLWGFCADYDYDYVFNQFAYAVGVKLKTSQGYKDLMNAIFESFLAGGAAASSLDLALAAICNIPLVRDPEETIEAVRHDAYGLFIATDKNIYRFSADAEPLVTEGQRVFAGQPLIDGFDVNEFRPGMYFQNMDDSVPVYRQAVTNFLTTHGFDYLETETEDDIILNTAAVCPPRKKDLAAIALDNGFISACFYGDLVFENREVPLHVVTNHPSGYTYVHFDLNGLPADVRRFFDEVHVRGIELLNTDEECHPSKRKIGTLAHLLDRRRYAETEPKEEHLPTSINPLRFLVENVLRNNVFIVRITISALGQKQLGLYNIRSLRQLLPPQTAMIVVFELTAPQDQVPSSSIAEAVGFFTGAEPAADEISNENVSDLGASLYLISGTCQ